MALKPRELRHSKHHHFQLAPNIALTANATTND